MFPATAPPHPADFDPFPAPPRTVRRGGFPAPPRPIDFWPCPAPPREKKPSLSIPGILASWQISHLDLPAKQTTSRKYPILDFAVFEVSSGRQSLPWGGSQGCDGRNSVLFRFPDRQRRELCVRQSTRCTRWFPGLWWDRQIVPHPGVS